MSRGMDRGFVARLIYGFHMYREGHAANASEATAMWDNASPRERPPYRRAADDMLARLTTQDVPGDDNGD